VARSSSGGVALRYVLLVLWMTTRLAVMGATPERVGSTQRRQSITCAIGAESDVYECLFFTVLMQGQSSLQLFYNTTSRPNALIYNNSMSSRTKFRRHWN